MTESMLSRPLAEDLLKSSSRYDDRLRACVIGCSGNLDKLKKLVDNKVDPNQGDYDLRTAIHVVGESGIGKFGICCPS